MISIAGIMREQQRSEGIVTVETINNKIDFYAGAIDAAIRGAAAGVEIVAGRVEKQFMEARVTGARARRCLTPEILGQIARNLIERGESLHLIVTDRTGMIELRLTDPYWYVNGSDDPKSWYIDAQLSGPTENRRVVLPRSAWLHVIQSPDPYRPYRGIPATARASITAELAKLTEDALLREARLPSKAIFPIPNQGGRGASIADQLRADLGRRLETVSFPETTAGRPGSGSPQTDWKAQRVQPMPDPNLVVLSREVTGRVIAALGGHPALAGGGTQAADREARKQMRDFLTEPLAALVAAAASRALDEKVTITWPAQDDVRQVRARTFDALVKAGADPKAAAEAAGFPGLKLAPKPEPQPMPMMPPGAPPEPQEEDKPQPGKPGEDE